METPDTRTPLKVTINPDKNTELFLSGWPINTQFSDLNEGDRVSAEKGGKSYSIVFQKDGAVYLEVWEIDAQGELGENVENLRVG